MTELLESSCALLDRAGLQVLAWLSLFPTGSRLIQEMEALASAVRGAGEIGPQPDAETRKVGGDGLDGLSAAGLIDRVSAGGIARAGLYRVHPAVQAWGRARSALPREEGQHGLLGLLAHALQTVAIHRGAAAHVEARLAHLFSMFEIGWSLEGARPLICTAVGALHDHLHQRGHWSLLSRWQPRLASVADADPRARSLRLHRESQLLHSQGRYEDAMNASTRLTDHS